MKHIPTRYFAILFRASIAFIFLYFGFLAVSEPEIQGALWVSPKMASLFTPFLSLKTFMLALGMLQIITGLGILFKIYFRYALMLAALLLVGIIVNLGWNDIAIRDFIILTSVLYFLSMERNRRI